MHGSAPPPPPPPRDWWNKSFWISSIIHTNILIVYRWLLTSKFETRMLLFGERLCVLQFWMCTPWYRCWNMLCKNYITQQHQTVWLAINAENGMAVFSPTTKVNNNIWRKSMKWMTWQFFKTLNKMRSKKYCVRENQMKSICLFITWPLEDDMISVSRANFV